MSRVPLLVRWGHRMVSPFLSLRGALRTPGRYASYVRDLLRYRSMPGAERIRTADLFPCLHDKGSNPFDPHYFYQDTWAFREVLSRSPRRHVDVGSTAIFVGMVSAATEIVFVDIRPLKVTLDRYTFKAGSILDMPFESGTVESLSCLHVAEHIGLGRYGDPLDPEGTRKAARELTRVLAPGGTLLFSVPIGRPRVQFNAHRIHSAFRIVEYFSGLDLVEFSGVDDAGVFLRGRKLGELDSCEYGCGFFTFRKSGRDAAR